MSKKKDWSFNNRQNLSQMYWARIADVFTMVALYLACLIVLLGIAACRIIGMCRAASTLPRQLRYHKHRILVVTHDGGFMDAVFVTRARQNLFFPGPTTVLVTSQCRPLLNMFCKTIDPPVDFVWRGTQAVNQLVAKYRAGHSLCIFLGRNATSTGLYWLSKHVLPSEFTALSLTYCKNSTAWDQNALSMLAHDVEVKPLMWTMKVPSVQTAPREFVRAVRDDLYQRSRRCEGGTGDN